MTHVRVSAFARQDIRDILSDLSRRAGHAVAGRYGADFRQVYRILAEFPDSGASRPALEAAARIKIVHPYVMIYDHRDDIESVLRVLHGHRDITVDLLARSRGVARSPRG